MHEAKDYAVRPPASVLQAPASKPKPGSLSHPLLRAGVRASGRSRPAPPFATSEIYLSAEAAELRSGGRARRPGRLFREKSTRPPPPPQPSSIPPTFLLPSAAARRSFLRQWGKEESDFLFSSFAPPSFSSSRSCLRPFSWPIRKGHCRRRRGHNRYIHTIWSNNLKIGANFQISLCCCFVDKLLVQGRAKNAAICAAS